MNYKKFFSGIAIVLMMCSFNSYGQSRNTELRFLDEDAGNVYAGMRFTGIDKTEFNKIVEKANSLKLYTVSNIEFAESKQIGLFTLKSNSNSTILDFQAFVKQLEISSLQYKGKTISTQEINANYVPLLNKSEVINKQRQ